jgi:phosphoribosylamine--glycine ligase
LINVGGEPYVIEYNCRMGDPETEVVMPRLKTDIVKLFKAMDEVRLNECEVDIDPRAASTVVLVSGGYPGDFEKGKQIKGLDTPLSSDTIVFYAGITGLVGDLRTNGGRVAAITSYGKDINEAVEKSLDAIKLIGYERMNFRKDIGFEFRT